MGKPFEFTPGQAVGSFIGGALQRYIQMKDRDAGFSQQKQMLEQRGSQAKDVLQQQIDEQNRRTEEQRGIDVDEAARKRQEALDDYVRSLKDKISLPARQAASKLEWYGGLTDEEQKRADAMGLGMEADATGSGGGGKGETGDVVPYATALSTLKAMEDKHLDHKLSFEAREIVIDRIMAGYDARDAILIAAQETSDKGLPFAAEIPFEEARTKIRGTAEVLVEQFGYASMEDALPVAEEMLTAGIQDHELASRAVQVKMKSSAVEAAMRVPIGNIEMNQKIIPAQKTLDTYRDITGTSSKTPFDLYLEVDPSRGELDRLAPNEIVVALHDAGWDELRIQSFFEDLYDVGNRGFEKGLAGAGKFSSFAGEPGGRVGFLQDIGRGQSLVAGDNPQQPQTGTTTSDALSNLFGGRGGIFQYKGGVRREVPTDTTGALPAWLLNRQQGQQGTK